MVRDELYGDGSEPDGPIGDVSQYGWYPAEAGDGSPFGDIQGSSGNVDFGAQDTDWGAINRQPEASGRPGNASLARARFLQSSLPQTAINGPRVLHFSNLIDTTTVHTPLHTDFNGPRGRFARRSL